MNSVAGVTGRSPRTPHEAAPAAQPAARSPTLSKLSIPPSVTPFLDSSLVSELGVFSCTTDEGDIILMFQRITKPYNEPDVYYGRI